MKIFMNPMILPFYAVAGSLMAELVLVYYYLQKGGLPKWYRQRVFYVVRIGIAIGAGILPSVFAAETLTAAFALGVGAPLVVNQITASFNKVNK
jgi:hypothetical protein